MKKILSLTKSFTVPLIVVFGMVVYGLLLFSHVIFVANIVIIAVTILGSYDMFLETLVSITKKQFALDYIAILAIVVGLLTHQFLVAAILALMVSGGRNLEEYGVSQAKKSLTQLIDRIPTDVTLWKDGQPGIREKLSNIRVGMEIFLRKGEVIGLDGVLVSPAGEIDESSLTGEPYFNEKVTGDIIRSGTINVGEPIVVQVTKAEKDSTYKKIINMVKEAQEEKSPLIRLADKYSTFFTIITFVIAGCTYIFSGFDLSRVLSVLAVATPCPLIIATPIALLGGVNASAKQKIIVKKLAALEILSEADTILLDKTGTITLGIPKLVNLLISDKKFSQKQIFSIAEAIERNSLHPLAKAIVSEARANHALTLPAREIKEEIGKGISGIVADTRYTLARVKETLGMSIELTKNNKRIALFQFEDEIKTESKATIADLISHGLTIKMLTGDKKEAAQRVLSQLGSTIQLHAQCSPEDKQEEIQTLKKQGKITAMVGDGINDAPALALADVGVAFANQEQTAASEAADIVILGGNFTKLLESLQIAKRTIAIANQSIRWGIGLSIVAMLFASVGLIIPIFGAGLQEAIDVAVILNALRATKA
ncbi:MAG: heavy metal translocating P-type ATPase [Candidatus Levyibacteriota bacterium]